ncbi:type II toxin-antitoxin system RelE/ParE family toxin [Haloechinothrix salitolerans]|uniref:Type II toxin-antitoxin system RelE/ParE family toxin n=1 Tax=Haloechinothrix salitolerans TaxID=926830 RepID=A0ABW2C8J8_9PSEU
MTYRVEISRRAAKAVASLDTPVRRKVLVAIESLGDNPRPSGCKKLSGSNSWRIRAAYTYRVIYEIHDRVLLVTVVDVGHRREIYR